MSSGAVHTWHFGDIDKVEDGLPLSVSKQSCGDGNLRVLPRAKNDALSGNRARDRQSYAMEISLDSLTP
jgi:hypothetical protein